MEYQQKLSTMTSRKTVAWQPSCFVKTAELNNMTREITDSSYRRIQKRVELLNLHGLQLVAKINKNM